MDPYKTLQDSRKKSILLLPSNNLKLDTVLKLFLYQKRLTSTCFLNLKVINFFATMLSWIKFVLWCGTRSAALGFGRINSWLIDDADLYFWLFQGPPSATNFEWNPKRFGFILVYEMKRKPTVGLRRLKIRSIDCWNIR